MRSTSAMTAGVSKSGSPAARRMTGTPAWTSAVAWSVMATVLEGLTAFTRGLTDRSREAMRSAASSELAAALSGPETRLCLRKPTVLGASSEEEEGERRGIEERKDEGVEEEERAASISKDSYRRRGSQGSGVNVRNL